MYWTWLASPHVPEYTVPQSLSFLVMPDTLRFANTLAFVSVDVMLTINFESTVG
jgi:hypothetical protein